MKIKRTLLACVAALSIGLAGCEKKNKNKEQEPDQQQHEEVVVNVESIAVTPKSVSLHIGDTQALTVTFTPENTTNKGLTFTSANPDVATVSAEGVITGVANGTTSVLVQSQQDPSKLDIVSVSVSTLHIDVQDLTVTPENIAINVGGSADLTVTVSPENASDKSVSFTSFDTSIATVDAEGHVVGVNKGNTNILVASVDNPSVYKQVPVSVTLPYVAVSDVEVSSLSMTMVAGSTRKIYANVLPTDATDKELTFASDAEGVATVAADGTVTAVANGSANIRVSAHDNATIFKNVAVTVADAIVNVSGVELTEDDFSMEENAAPVQLHATVSPNNASDKSISWNSSNPAVAYVSQSGLVTPASAGSTVITVTTADGGHTDTVTVTVTKTAATGISLNRTSLLFEIADTPAESTDPTFELVATIAPEGATYQEIQWVSSNPNVVSVEQDAVDGKKATVTRGVVGNATVTAIHRNSGLTESCAVTVRNVQVTGVALNKNILSFLTTDTGNAAQQQLTATLTPSNTPDKDVTWTSSDPNIATVSNSGLVTKVSGSAGTTIITATHNVSHLSASCVVTVVEAEDLTPTVPISPNKAYQSYKNNIKANPTNRLAEFADREQMYEVGDDNKINLRPDFTLLDGNDNIIDSNAWSYPFSFKVEVLDSSAYVTADAADYSVINAKTCDIKFNDSAVGNIYKVSITLGGLTDEEIADFGDEVIAVYELKVVDGYNVTNEYEMAYLDSSTSASEQMGMGSDHYSVDFPAFKVAHGLNGNVAENPKTLVLHKDMNISKEHVPSENFCSLEDAEAGNWDASERSKAIGSLKDDGYMYRIYNDGKTTLSGNYFTLDWSRIPLVKRTRGKATSLSSKVESHAGFIRTHAGELEVKNINFIGNAHAATSSADEAFAGGLIGFKIRYNCSRVLAYNTLGHGCYITYMNEGAYSTLPNGAVCSLEITKTKLYDNYNCFIYNWGGKVIAEQSLFEGCGGPCVIQDHVKDGNDEYDEFDFDSTTNYRYKFNYKGHRSETSFIDCEINNYVIGTEAWFVSFNADALTAQIKQMCDLVAGVNGTRTAIFDSNHNPATFAGLSGASQDSLFNFSVLNKSGSAEGITNVQVDGRVQFLHRESNNSLTPIDDFNYQNPTVTGDEYISYPDNRFTVEAARFAKFRGTGSAGAPIFETAGGCAYWPGEGTSLLDIDSAGGSPTVVSTDFATNAGQNLALYYNGMMLVMSLASFA